ncbi:MAG: hypothetical protein JWR50_1072 [Mucilaginibacter sp.]|nr:hypothetical protein [Mucilaginibacter sp.]
MIIPHSNSGLAKNPRPAKGKHVSSTGTTAQCIAQSVDAVMPILSNLEPSFLDAMPQIYINATLLRFLFS